MINFRAWDKENNTMLTWEQLKSEADFSWFADENLVFMQSTQFHTAWGDLIYEGDVMAAIIDGERKHTNFTVVCGGGKYGMIGKKIDKSGFIFVQLDRINGCKMLGNIYENPELLEVAE